MAKVKIQGHASGTGVITLTAPNTSTDRTVTLPDADVTLGASPVTALNNATANELVTVGATTTELDAEANLTFDGTDLTLGTGDIVFATAGKGICLGVTSNTDANTLDDYEEGTWTPTLTCTVAGSYSLDSSANLLAYTKIGRVVHIQGGISITGRSSEDGLIRLTLPFTPMTGTDDTDYCEGSATLYNHGGTIPNGIKIFVYGDTHAYFRTVADNGTGSYIDHTDTDAEFQMRFSFTYIAV